MKERALGIAKLVCEYHRDFHMQPELGLEEEQTSEKIASSLEGLGIRVRGCVGKTGVVGEIRGGKPVVGIRADPESSWYSMKHVTCERFSVDWRFFSQMNHVEYATLAS